MYLKNSNKKMYFKKEILEILFYPHSPFVIFIILQKHFHYFDEKSCAGYTENLLIGAQESMGLQEGAALYFWTSYFVWQFFSAIY